jgi:hypothetical protein
MILRFTAKKPPWAAWGFSVWLPCPQGGGLYAAAGAAILRKIKRIFYKLK